MLYDKLAFYKDLDVEEFNRATENYANIQIELKQTSEAFRLCDQQKN